MAYDPTISAGNILTIVTVVGVSITFLMRQSYSAGKYAQEFVQVHKDLGEIKETLKEQDKVSRDKARSDSLSDGLLLVLQQRMRTAEREIIRSRNNIHHIANKLQVKVLEHEMEDENDSEIT